MKVGAEDRRTLAAACGLLTLATLLMGHWIFGSQSSALANFGGSTETPAIPARSAPKIKLKNSDTLDPTLRIAQLELTEHEVYEGSGRSIFQSYGQDQPEKSRPAPKKPESTTPAAILVSAAAPPIGLKFYGTATTVGSPRKVCLAQDGDIFIGGEGDIVDRRYKILQIGSNTVEVEDLLDNKRYTLTLQQ